MAFIIYADGEYQHLKTKGKEVTLEEAQAVVGGYVEVVPLEGYPLLLVNENGIGEGLEVNQEASRIALKRGQRHILLGNVLVIQRGEGWDEHS